MDIGVFVLGAPRSGTTWLQAMLGAHPEIVSPQETGLVHQFLAPWAAEFDRKLAIASQDGATGRVVGLPVVLTHEQFRDVLRDVVGVVADAAIALKPDARVVVEKTPDNARHVDLIRWLAPDARFIHIVRDGRDVAASLLAASSSWAGTWAPKDVRRAAAVWKEHVLGAASAAAAGDRYTEVRYTDLLEHGPRELERLLEFCGVDAARVDAAEVCEQFSFERMSSSADSTFQSVVVGGEAARVTRGATREPDGFYRVGKPGSWRSWGARECWSFDDVAGDLLVELGFESGREWCAPTGASGRARRVATRRARAAMVASRRLAGGVARRALASSGSA